MKHRDGILDLVRGLSALLVMLGHLRGFIFVDYGALAHPGVLQKALYFATGLGHQAVMVFFVLSGYFVGGSILAGLQQGSFSWRGYAAARLSRLWMVLGPALLLTAGLDWLGGQWNPAAYAGGFHASFLSGPTVAQPAARDLLTVVGNLGFVQTVCVPVFGSNGPLWSLANEFWYYLLFPLVAVAVVGCRMSVVRRVAQVGLAAAIAWWLPQELVMAGLIWLLGAVAWWILRKAAARGWVQSIFRSWGWRLAGGGLFLGTLVASRTGSWLGSDQLIGVAFALWLLSLTGSWRRLGWWSRLSTGLSEISYTLYVVHFPLLFFVAAAVLKGRQFPADGLGLLWFGGLAVVTLVLAVVMWWAFERNTVRLRKWLSGGA